MENNPEKREIVTLREFRRKTTHILASREESAGWYNSTVPRGNVLMGLEPVSSSLFVCLDHVRVGGRILQVSVYGRLIGEEERFCEEQ